MLRNLYFIMMENMVQDKIGIKKYFICHAELELNIV